MVLRKKIEIRLCKIIIYFFLFLAEVQYIFFPRIAMAHKKSVNSLKGDFNTETFFMIFFLKAIKRNYVPRGYIHCAI